MTKSPKFRVTYKINGEIAIKNKPDTFIQLEYETYRILPDGSVSNSARNRVRNEGMENSWDWSYARHYPIGVGIRCLRLIAKSIERSKKHSITIF